MIYQTPRQFGKTISQKLYVVSNKLAQHNPISLLEAWNFVLEYWRNNYGKELTYELVEKEYLKGIRMESNITFYTTKVTDREEWIEASAGIYGEEFREQTIRYLNSFDILAQDFDFIFVCDNFGEVVGRCIVAPPREAIFGFIIDNRYRHKGYGKKLLQHVIDTYKGTLKLDTNNTLFFYLAENLGFKYVGTIIDEITNLPTLKMERVSDG